MALQSSGQITLGEIAAEYGGSAPHALSEYHDKGNAPASGEIQIAADFYGTSNLQTLAYSGGVSEVTASDNSSTDVSSSSHIVMGLAGRSDGTNYGASYGTAVTDNNKFYIKVRSKSVVGASGALSRGTISEVGPTNVGSNGGCGNTMTNQLCSSNKFLVGIRVNSIPSAYNGCLWYGRHYFQIYRREASMSSAIHNGSQTHSSTYYSGRNGYGSNSDLGTNRFGTGFGIAEGGSGEFTDGAGWAWFGYRVTGQDAMG